MRRLREESCIARTIYIQRIVRVRLPHDVVGLAAVRPVVGLVEVIDEQVGPGQHGVLGHLIIDSHPGYLDRPAGKRGDRCVIALVKPHAGRHNQRGLTAGSVRSQNYQL